MNRQLVLATDPVPTRSTDNATAETTANKAKTRILLIEDSEVDRLLLERVLNKSGLSFELERVATSSELEKALSRQPADIVISDYTLPGFGALEALAIVRRFDVDCSFVVISGAVGEETAVALMRSGVSDFIIKSALPRLPLVIERELKEAAGRKARREAELELKNSQEQLKAALIEAQAASELKTAFLANMSHEIRTPIGAILGYAELASELEMPENCDLQLYLKAIRRNGEQLLGLIGDLLDLTKIEADRLELENVAFDLGREIDSVILATSPAIKSKKLELKLEISNLKFPNLVSDPTRVKQILINLLSNAVKFTERGQIGIALTQREVNGLIETRISVSDTGIGLGPKETSRLFEPFMQGDASTSRKFGGTGLGLSLSRKLAQNLNGDLQLVKSLVGMGSTFEFSFHAPPPGTEFRAKIPIARAQLEGILSGFKILLVEDSTDNQVIVKHFLAPTGVEIDIASTGQEGLDLVARNSYSLILMDLQLPGIDGSQTTKKLRELGFTTPVIALTAHAFKGAREKAIGEGFTDYVTKPIDRTVLTATLLRHLARSSTKS